MFRIRGPGVGAFPSMGMLVNGYTFVLCSPLVDGQYYYSYCLGWVFFIALSRFFHISLRPNVSKVPGVGRLFVMPWSMWRYCV